MMTDSINLLGKSNMLLLSKELNEKDRKLKAQLKISTKNEDKTPSENVWMENGFFKDIKSDFNIFKTDFPKDSLIYINQAQLTIKKEPVIYSSYFILRHIIPLLNPQQDFDNYVSKENEVKILVLLYDKSNGNFKGIKQILTHMLTGDKTRYFSRMVIAKNFQKFFILFLNKKPLKAFKSHFKGMREMHHRKKFQRSFFFSLQ